VRLADLAPRTGLLATVAGWALLAWLLAVLGMGGQVHPLPDDASLLKPLPTPRASPPERLGSMSQYAEIAARPLFTDDRRPRPFSLQAQGEGEEDGNAFDFILTSVLITPGLQMAILQPSGGGESLRVKLGDAPESAPGWRLIDLKPRNAVFAGPGGEKSMDLRVFDGTGGEPPTQASVEPDAATPASRAIEPAARPATPPPKPAPAPQATMSDADAPAPPESQEAQIEAIRKRIEARRAQMRQQSRQPDAPVKNP